MINDVIKMIIISESTVTIKHKIKEFYDKYDYKYYVWLNL